MVNGLFPIVSEKFYGAPGKKCNGNPKGDLTYAAKFSDTFNFLKTYKFDTYSGNVTNSVNLMNVMNEFKAFSPSIVRVTSSDVYLFNFETSYKIKNK